MPARGYDRRLPADPRPGLARRAVIPVLRRATRRRGVVGEDVDAARAQQRRPVPHARAALDERRVRGENLEGPCVRDRPGKERRELPASLGKVERRREPGRRADEQGHQLEIRVLPASQRAPPPERSQPRAVLIEQERRVHQSRRSSTPPSWTTLPPTTVSTERIFFRSSFGTAK